MSTAHEASGVPASGHATTGGRFSLAALALFVGLTVLHTWPLASAPGYWSRNDTHDTVHHEWIMAWDVHQIVRDPRHLFDTNTFYPETDTLAYSDHIIVQALMAAPLLWAGASPVLAYNITLMLGYALTGWAMCLLITRWTGSRAAGLISGSLAAFNSMTLTRMAEIQDQHLQFFPWAVLALDRLLASPRTKHALHLAAAFVLQALTCGYILVFAALSLVASVAARATEVARTPRRTGPLLLVAAVVSGAVLLPFLLPYLRVSTGQGFSRPPDEVALYSARLTDYLASGGRLHYALWSQRFVDREMLFPGIVGGAMALAALVSGVAWRDRRARMALAFGVVGFAMSFGPAFPLYELVARAFPVMAGIRGASRFGQFFLIAVAVLAGFGWSRLRSTARVQRAPAWLAGALALSMVNVESLRAPINYRAFDGLSPAFDLLAAPDVNIVACFPFPEPREAFHNVDCMLASTRFWKPLLNGYSSFMPQRYIDHARALDAFPEGDTLPYLKQHGVSHIIVFANKLSAPRLAHLDEHADLRLLQSDGPVRVYRLVP